MKKIINRNNILVFRKGVKTKLSFHFYSTEFDCKCDRPECQLTFIDDLLIKKLQWIRSSVGPVQINCGFRCGPHNKEVGGAEKSQHLEGTGADVEVRDITVYQLQEMLIEKQFSVGLTVGRYDNFTHLDTRPIPIVFDKREIKIDK